MSDDIASEVVAKYAPRGSSGGACYGFIRDRIIVIRPQAITGVEGRGPGESVHITFGVEGRDRVITIVTWRAPTLPIARNLLDSRDLDEKLRHVALALDPTASNPRLGRRGALVDRPPRSHSGSTIGRPRVARPSHEGTLTATSQADDSDGLGPHISPQLSSLPDLAGSRSVLTRRRSQRQC